MILLKYDNYFFFFFFSLLEILIVLNLKKNGNKVNEYFFKFVFNIVIF